MFAQYLAFFEDKTVALAACNAYIGFSCFARAVYRTAHHGNFYILIDKAAFFLYLVRKAYKVYLRSAAGRAGNEFHTEFTQFKAFKYLFCRFNFLNGVARKRNTDSIAYALRKYAAYADSRLYGTRPDRTAFGNAEVEGIVHSLAQNLVCLLRKRHA